MIFECVSKFPVKLQINSMDVAREMNKDDMTKGFLDIFCIQSLCVQQYMLDPDICLPEVFDEAAMDNHNEEEIEVGNDCQFPSIINSLIFLKNDIESH